MNSQKSPVFRAPMFQYVVALVVASYLFQPILVGGVFGHIALGRWILAQRALPCVNLWTILGADTKWFDASWAYDVVLAFLYSLNGEKTLLIFKLITLCLGVCGLNALYRSLSQDRFFAAIIASVCSVGVFLSNDLTPGLVSVAIFPFLFLTISRFTKAFEVKWALLSFVLVSLLANVYAPSFLATLSILLVVGIREGNGAAKKLLGIGVLLLIGNLFVTPYLGSQIGSVLADINRGVQAVFGQSEPMNIFRFEVAVLFILAALLGALGQANKKSVSPTELALAAFCCLVGLVSQTAVPYVVVILGSIVCAAWSKGGADSFGNLGQGLFLLRQKALKLPLEGGFFLLLSIAIVQAVRGVAQPIGEAALPKRELSYLLEHSDLLPLGHSAHLGDYVKFKFTDERGQIVYRAIADSNVGLSGEESLLAPVVLAFDNIPSGWGNLIKQERVNSVLCIEGTPLCEALKFHRDAELVFAGGEAVSTGYNPRKQGLYSVYRIRNELAER